MVYTIKISWVVINLDEEEIYTKAAALITELTKNGWDDNLKQIAFTSAAFDTLNTASKEGAKLEKIDCSNFSAVFYIPTYS